MASKPPAAELIWQRRSRASLMRSTALQAAALAVLATPAAAQLAPNAHPTGGSVSSGQASIANGPAKTTITQSSENAAINWQSYNVGSAQTVQYKQPNAASVTLNRVVGANPSQIAGHILANGQIVLVNQSGVVFSKGAQVDTAGLVVSTAGITDKNFMNGKLVFDQAGHLGASISNAGNITIRQAGLAALVAPQVANSGIITARLGRVILGGAETHTLDLYGDGLVALNVTGQVTKASVGGQQVTALVTNSGTILAPGGTVVLSASAADGLVTNLVEAGGRIAAPSVGAQVGRVLVQGIGGGISVDGDVSASGIAAGTKGGQVVAVATGAVRVGAGATIDASGDAGGGVIAVGTTAARAIGGASVTPTLVAQSVNLAAGSHLRANATHRGTGGRIAVLSQLSTTQLGDVSARGGSLGGDGGWVEVSGGKVGFGGALDVGAATGSKVGSILIDPTDLVVGTNTGYGDTVTYIPQSIFNRFSGNVILKTADTLTVDGTITANQLLSPVVSTLLLEGDLGITIKGLLNVPGAALALYAPQGAITESGGGIITAASLSAKAGGAITLGAANTISDIGAYDTPSVTSVTGAVSNGGPGTYASPALSDAVPIAGLTATGAIRLADAASLTIDSASDTSVSGTQVTIPAGTVTATGGAVSISVSGSTIFGQLLSTVPNSLTVQANVTGTNVALATAGTVNSYTGTAFSQSAGTISAVGSGTAAGTVAIQVAQGVLSIGGTILTSSPATSAMSGETSLTAAVGNITEVPESDGVSPGSIQTGTLTGSAGTGSKGNLPGNANFAIAGNTISTLTGFTTAGSFSLEDDTALSVTSTLTAGGDITISDSSASGSTAILVIDGQILSNGTGGNILLENSHGIAELTGSNAATPTSIGSTAGTVTLDSGGGILMQTQTAITSRLPASSGAGVVLASAGSTDFGSDLGTVAGMSLGGSITAGTRPGTVYTGLASLNAVDGDILQTGGGIHVETLFGSVSDSLTTTPRNLSLSASSGNTISFITQLTATGSLSVEDDVALNVGTLTAGTSIDVRGPTAAVTAPGSLTLAGPVTAGTNISLQNNVGIIIDSVLTAGPQNSTGGYTGTLSLIAKSGNVTEDAGASLLAGTLSGSAATGNVTLNAANDGEDALGNTITTIGSFSVGGSFALLVQSGLTIEALDAGGGITVEGTSKPGDFLVLAGNITAGTAGTSTALFEGFPGIVEQNGASVTNSLGTVTLVTSGALFQQAGSSLSAGSLSLLAKGGTDFGGTPDAGTMTGITFDGSIKAGSALLSATAGDISEGSTATLLSGTVVADASGTLNLAPGFGNQIGTLSGTAQGGDASVESDTAMSIGNLSATTSLTVLAPTAPGTQTGSLTITGKVTAPDAVSLSNKLGITETATGTISSPTGSVTLSSGAGITFDGVVTAGTLSGKVPTGAVSLTALDGNIVEGATGRLGVQILAGSATKGSASFTATSGNEVGTLSNFAVGGNFALEDDAGLLVTGQTADSGSIHIFGPSSAAAQGGFLVLDGPISARDNITLSNAIGVVALSGVDIKSTSGGVSLVSSGGAILEQAGATIQSGATSQPGFDAVSLQAGGHTSFGDFGTFYGIEIDGSVIGGTANAAGTAYAGSTSLSATLGDITEGTLASISTGSLSAVATGGGKQGTEPVGNVSLAGTGTNLISAIGNSSADGNVTVVDTTTLTLGALHADGAISVQDNAASTGILIIGGAVSAVGSISLANRLGIAELNTGSVASSGGTVALASSDGAIFQRSGGSIAGGTSGGKGDFVSLSASGTTNFGSYGVSGADDPVAGISFGGVITSGSFSGGLYSGTATFAVSGGSIAEADTGTLNAGILTGTVTGGASFTTTASPGNVVGTLSAFAVGGSFSLEDDSGLVVLGQSAAGSIDIHGPAAGLPTGLLVLEDAISAKEGVNLDNRFGILALASVTSTLAGVTITSSQGAFAQKASTVISAGGTQGISILADGGSDFSKVQGSPFGSLSGITFDGTLHAGTGAATLTAVGGNITEGSAAILQAATLDGSTSGIASLDFGASSTGSNLVTAIGSFHSGGDTNFEDSLGLAIGTLTAGGNVDIHGPLTGSASGMITLTGTLSGAGGTVTLDNDHGISLGGTLTAGSLSGQVYTGFATLTVADGNIVETTGGSVRAGTLTGSASGNAAFGNAGNAVSVLAGFTAGGNFTLDDSAALLQVAGAVSGSNGVSLGNALGIVELTGASVQSSAGSIALTASDGGILQQKTASLTAATGLSLDAGGSSDFGTVLTGQTSGTIDGISFAGRMSAGGSASLIADAGNIVEQSTGDLHAVTLSATASTTLASIAGSILLASVSSPTAGNQVGTLAASSAAAGFGLVDGQALTVTGAVQAGGTTAGNLQIVAPAIDVISTAMTTGSLQLLAPAGSAPGVIDLVADHFVFGTPGAVSTPGGLVALDLLNAGSSGTTFAVGGATISGASLSNIQSQRGTLSIGQALNAGGTLTSTPNTGTGSWTLGAVGTVTAIDFSAPVNFGNPASPAALGLFSDDTINVSNGITVASLYGSAGSPTAATGTASILGSNAIGTLGVRNDAGDLVGFLTQRAGPSGPALQFQLADTTPLLVLGPVAAPQGAVAISVSGTQNALTIGSTAVPLSGQITGTDIALAATGTIVQAAGTLDATGAATGTNGTIAIASSGGAVTLNSVVEGASADGTANAHSALLLDAGAGDITEGPGAQLTAGTLAALASGSISLAGTTNSFAVIGSLTSLADTVTLYGVTAGGAGGIVLNDTSGLLIADDTFVGNVRELSVYASGGPVDISLASGGLSLGATVGTTIEAVGPVNLNAPGFITENGGTIASQNAGATLSTLGSVSQYHGTLIAGGGDVLVTAPTGFTSTNAGFNGVSGINAFGEVAIISAAGAFLQDNTVIGGQGVLLDIHGNVTSIDNSTIGAGTSTVAIASRTGGITLDTVTAGDVLLSAAGGDITQATSGTLIAGTLAASASGNIDLASDTNQIFNIGSLSSQGLSLTLAGLFASGTTGITLVDDTSLNILADSGTPVVQANSAGATLSIDVIQAAFSSQGTSYGSLTIGSFGASTLESNGAMTLQATGSVFQTASTLMAGGNLSITATNGDINETGGSLIQSAQDAGLTAGGTFNQSASILSGAHSVGVNAGGDVVSVGGTIQSAGIGSDATSGTVALSAGGSMTLESLVSAGTLGAVHLAALGDIRQVSADGSLVGTIIAPSLAAAAGGDLSLTGPNQVAAITAAAPLTGLSAGTGNVDLVNIVSLALSPGASVTALNGTIRVDVTGASAPSLVSNGATVHALGDVTLSASGSLNQAGGLFQSDQGSVNLDANGFTQAAGAVVLADIAVQIDAGAGGMALSGTLQAGAPTNGVYGGAIGLSTGGAILAPTANLLTGTLAAAAGGTIDLNGAGNEVAQIGIVGSLSGLTGATIMLQDAQSLVVTANVMASDGIAITIPTADFIELPGVSINASAAPLSVAAGGDVVIGGTMTGGATDLSAGGALTQQAGADIAAGTAIISAGTGLTIDGTVTTNGAVTFSAGTVFTEGAGAVIETNLNGISPGPLTLTAPGTITIDGLLQVAGPLMIIGGTVIEDSTGVVTADATSITATSGADTLNGMLTANGTLSLVADTDVSIGQTGILVAGATTIDTVLGDATIAGALTVNGALAVTAGGNLTVAPTGTVIAGATTLTATGGAATIGGSLTANGALGLTASSDVTVSQGGTIAAGATDIAATNGAATIDGVLTARGPLDLAIGTDVNLGQFGRIAATDTTISAARGTAGIAGILAAGGTLTLTAGTDIGIATTGTVTANATTITATAGDATIDGLLLVNGPLALTAGNNVTLDQPGTITAGATTITATSGAATIDGSLSANGALGLSAATDVSLGQPGLINAGDTTITAAGGNATIDGALTAHGTLSLTAGSAFSIGATGSVITIPGNIDYGIMVDAATITAGTGNATIDGLLSVNGALVLTAGNNFMLDQTGRVSAGFTTIAATQGAAIIDGAMSALGTLSLKAGTAFALDATGSITAGPTTIAAGTDALIGGSLDVESSLGLTAGTDVTLAQGGNIAAANTTIAATAGNATIDGALVADGALSLTAGGAFVLDPTGSVTSGPAMIDAGTAATIGGTLGVSGSLALMAGTDVTLAQGGGITAGATTITATTGSASIDGVLMASGPLGLLAASDVTEGASGFISGMGVGIQATSGSAEIGGSVQSVGGFSIVAGTDVTEDQGATIDGDVSAVVGPAVFHGPLVIPSTGGTIMAGGNITIDGALSDPLSLTLAAGNAATLGATGTIAGGLTSITATMGVVTLAGPLTATGDLTIHAGTDLLAQASLSSDTAMTLSAGGSIVVSGQLSAADSLEATAGADFTVTSSGAVTAPESVISASGLVTIDGPLTATGSLAISAGTGIVSAAAIEGGVSNSLTTTLGDITLGGVFGGLGDVSLAAGGSVAIEAAFKTPGAISVDSGNDILAQAAIQSAAGTIGFKAGGSITVDDVLAAPGTIALAAGGDVTLGQGADVFNQAAATVSAGGNVSIAGSLTPAGQLSITAGTDVSEATSGVISGTLLALSAKGGAVTLNGDFTSIGAFTINAHTNITQGAGSTIADTQIGTRGLSSSIAAPGTITLAGTLSASSLLIGDFLAGTPVTQSIIWDNTVVRTGSNATIHGATSSISIAAPLIAGQGALGVYTQSAAFQQTGIASVSAISGTGPSSTLQVAIEGRGDAKFASLIAPDAQLLLVLEQGGSASGEIDVAGLNVFYSDGIVPSSPVILMGDVGGRGGFAAAAVGFSHHLPNVNYQINGCPIESINCILLSPLLVPIVDPVNDYAEGTQRKRHQDDDALPNVGEEDY